MYGVCIDMAYKHNIPLEYQLDLSTIEDRIDQALLDYFAKYNIDITDYKTAQNLKHNTIISLMRYIYSQIFKPPCNLAYNQKSLMDYEDLETLYIVAGKFIDICSSFNKSQGLYCFMQMTGLDQTTVNWWKQQPDVNSERLQILKAVEDYNREALINLLKDSNIGQLAVANNDKSTGLEWAKNAQTTITNNAVYVLPTERSKLSGLLDTTKP